MGEKLDPRKHVGETHGIYTIVDALDKKDKYGNWLYKSKCNECGYEKISSYASVAAPSKIAKICKHLRINGDYIVVKYQWKNPRLKRIFAGILRRCYNKNDKSYGWYGGNGIQVCQEWFDNPAIFEEWALKNGYADDLTIDRLDINKDYCPENCRWITIEENTRRAGKVNWITIDNQTLTGKQWAKQLNIGINTVNKLVRLYGETKAKELISAMLKEPPSTKHRKSHQTWFDVYGIQI